MFAKKRLNGAGHNQASMSVIDEGCEFEGRLTFVGTLVVNGKLRGALLSSGTLLVGKTAELEAEVQVGTAIVSGQVKGNITAGERVEVKSSARIFGDIVTPTLVLEEGVVFEGHCKMHSDENPILLNPGSSQ